MGESKTGDQKSSKVFAVNKKQITGQGNRNVSKLLSNLKHESGVWAG